MKPSEEYNSTSNTIAGINTPSNQQDVASTDTISPIVEKIIDNIEKDMFGEPKSVSIDE